MVEENKTEPGPQAPSPQEGGPTPVDDLEGLKRALEEQTRKAETYLANWQRAQADLVNYRKKVDQEKRDLVTGANAGVVTALLPVVDDLERALSAVDPNIATLTWIDGVRLISRKLQVFLDSQGVTPINAAGERFDPSVHQAVMEVDGEEGKVLAELQRGYRIGDRVLRPAMVTVGRGKAPVDGSTPQATEAPNNA